MNLDAHGKLFLGTIVGTTIGAIIAGLLNLGNDASFGLLAAVIIGIVVWMAVLDVKGERL